MELVVRILRNSEAVLKTFFRSPWPPGFSPSMALEPSYAGLMPHHTSQPSENLEDKKSEGFLWGVPKKRRTVEVRMCRKIGAERWVLKIYKPKTNIRICENCGHHYEAKHLCRNCYDKVKEETKNIRKQAESQFGDNPEDKEIVVLYENEKERIHSQATKNKVIVELEKPRPQWFSSNLLQKSTSGPDSDTTTVAVTPKNLG